MKREIVMVVMSVIITFFIFSDLSFADQLNSPLENRRDKNVPPILNLFMDRRGFPTPPGGAQVKNHITL
ncbi:MAG: hypothetical protein HZA08_06065 [Nitrospirae bacterium]|nr:hypothetical protein [Nitrospirota bacterium]